MERIVINTPEATSTISVGENWEKAGELIPETGVVIITDENVRDLYESGFPDFPVISVKPGESSKTLSVIGYLSNELLRLGIDRSGFILAIGGGVVSDIAGFLAAIYMRGIRCGYVSSSLLSQVDASTGGKTGVDLAGLKNILGVIRQPEFVICDPVMLQTLPEDEYLSGLAELIKTAIIGDAELFKMLEKHSDDILARDAGLLEILISRAVRFKANVVAEDETEKGLRRILNFGHTFGHAIEAGLSLKHGFAVASGMVISASFSLERGFCSVDDTKRINDLLVKFGFTLNYDFSLEKMKNLVLHDKKKAGNDIYFIFNKGIGNATFQKIPVDTMIDFYKRFTS
ncbi:MAG TPA: 3-dehydroquinate synthase [Bacteroidales bacterium]|nr:3-dehydroquinate synthase [Bacteroidales bacterium]